jgi:hypothetical protein
MTRWLVLCVPLALASCSKASDSSEAKKLQSAPPPRDVEVPAGLSIAVEVDGTAKAAITADTLKTIKPDFSDVERKVWLIPTLIPEATPGSIVEAASPNGVSMKLAHPTSDGLEPVLFLTRRGELIVSEIDPKDPFPKYHGQGGRLHRAGDSMPRVAPVGKLSITHPK